MTNVSCGSCYVILMSTQVSGDVIGYPLNSSHVIRDIRTTGYVYHRFVKSNALSFTFSTSSCHLDDNH